MTDDTNKNGAENPTKEGRRDSTPPSSNPENKSPEIGESPSTSEPVDPLTAAQAEADQLKDKLIRMAADFDNFRKRSRREVADSEKKGRDSLLLDLLPVFDNLERATSHASSAEAAADSASIKGLVDGITLVLRQFRDALSRIGIERVESVGQPFDPSVHEAIQHLETSDFPPGCIAAEVQPGYRQGDRLVRPAMVVVAKAPSEPVTADGAPAGSSTAESTAELSSTGSSSSPNGDQSGGGESPGA